MALELVKAGVLPVAFEYSVSPGFSKNWADIKSAIECSSGFLLIIGDRLGAPFPEEPNISFTQKEFLYAVELKKKIVVFNFSGRGRRTKYKSQGLPLESKAKKSQLKKFVSSINDSHLNTWNNDSEFKEKVSSKLPRWVNQDLITSTDYLISNSCDSLRTLDDRLDTLERSRGRLRKEIEKLEHKISFSNYVINQVFPKITYGNKPQLPVRQKMAGNLADIKDVSSASMYIRFLIQHYFYPSIDTGDLRSFFAFPKYKGSKTEPDHYRIVFSSSRLEGLSAGEFVSQKSNVHSATLLQSESYIDDLRHNGGAEKRKDITNQEIENEETVWAMPVYLDTELLGVVGFSGARANMFDTEMFQTESTFRAEFDWVVTVLDAGLDLKLCETSSAQDFHGHFDLIISALGR